MKILRQPPYLSKDKLFFGIIFSSLYFFLYITLTVFGGIYMFFCFIQNIYIPPKILKQKNNIYRL